MTNVSTSKAWLALCIAASGCATSAPPVTDDARDRAIAAAQRESPAPGRPSRPAKPDDPPARPHEFGAARLFSTKTDGGTRPDYVLIRVTRGAAHGDEDSPQPVLHVQFIAAGEEGSTTCRTEGDAVVIAAGGGVSAAVVADGIAIGRSVHAFEVDRIDWPSGHEDQVAPGPPTLAFASDTGRPTDFHCVYDVDRAGKDAVDLTFQFTTRSQSIVLFEIPETTVRVRYGQCAVFPTRRAAADAR